MDAWEQMVKEWLQDVLGRRRLGQFLAMEREPAVTQAVQAFITEVAPQTLSEVLRYRDTAALQPSELFDTADVEALIAMLPEFHSAPAVDSHPDAPTMNI